MCAQSHPKAGLDPNASLRQLQHFKRLDSLQLSGSSDLQFSKTGELRPAILHDLRQEVGAGDDVAHMFHATNVASSMIQNSSSSSWERWGM